MQKQLRRFVLASLLCAAGVASAGPALTPNSVTVNSVTLPPWPPQTVSYTLNGQAGSAYAGGINVSSSAGSFEAFCVELNQQLWPLPTSSYTSDPNAAYVNDALSRLFHHYRTENPNKVAMQVAVWESVYDAAPGNLAGGNFLVSAPSDVLLQANTILSRAAGLAPGSYATDSLRLFTSATHQDFVTSIPEPSTYALMLAGLAVAGAVARRRGSR